MRAPSAELVLLLYGRGTAPSEHLAAEGDVTLLSLWLDRTGFWLRE